MWEEGFGLQAQGPEKAWLPGHRQHGQGFPAGPTLSEEEEIPGQAAGKQLLVHDLVGGRGGEGCRAWGVGLSLERYFKTACCAALGKSLNVSESLSLQ